MTKLKKMMLSANGQSPTPRIWPFSASDSLNSRAQSPIRSLRTPNTKDVATRAMRHAQKSFMSGRSAEADAELMEKKNAGIRRSFQGEAPFQQKAPCDAIPLFWKATIRAHSALATLPLG